MTVMQSGGGSRPSPTGLADVIETILDKGMVIDAYVRVSLVGIEVLTIDARVVIASVDTYLRFAEAVNRLDIMQEGGAKHKTKGVLDAATDKLRDFAGNGERERQSARRGRREED
jgi:hypothetical protein